jgi:cytochrome c oxidase subunit II
MTGRFPACRPYTADAVARDTSKTRRRLRTLAVLLPVALVGALVLSPAASAGWFLPESGGSPNADKIKTLYILITLLALVIFIGVEGLLFYSLFKYRARKGRVAAQIHGNTQLEIGWTVGAAVILVFITVFTFILLPGIKNPAKSDITLQGQPVASAHSLYAATDQPAPPEGVSMPIDIVGQQYSWYFGYPDLDNKHVYAYNTLYVPVGMTVTLNIKSVDVAHSWWIPKLGGKADAIPGYTNHTWFKIPPSAIPEGSDRVIFTGQCAELCGRNHADMVARVIGLRYDAWKAWYDNKARQLQQAKQDAAAARKKLTEEESQ